MLISVTAVIYGCNFAILEHLTYYKVYTESESGSDGELYWFCMRLLLILQY